MTTAATEQLRALLAIYQKFLPISTFPYVTLALGAVFQVFAWLGGSTILGNLTLIPRIFALWLLAFGEYTFMSPTMNAGVEVLNMSEPVLVVLYQIITLIVFLFINFIFFRKKITWKIMLAFVLLGVSVILVHI